ncbi:hypothetical protein IAE60_03775 [Pseudoxanthomonas mexicana]|uniref:Uncharacterized protein n=1 Tax=Pseudoxanthomonas mexicana TaxID=128785 RepID=A0A7G9TEP4_PSEMX|nr:hypothetical protein [Pseudoxanthomonas mexicana]QNN78569.1 hypothetical protein IAE60_03775 [Pseudoxanthomonas mexicana]
MRAIGYMYKRVETPEGFDLPGILDVYSLGACVNDDFADYIGFWKHNGYFLFDSPAVMRALADEHEISLEGLRLFYYEAHDLQFDGDSREWVPFGPFHDDVNVQPPARATLEGFDITSFWAGAGPECSPLSCNYLARSIETNKHCLLPTFEAAVDVLESGAFKNAKPGPYRIVAVYSVAETE